MAGLATMILRANVDETVSVMAAVGGVLGGVAALLALWDRIRSQSATEGATRPSPSHQPPTEFPGGVGGGSAGVGGVRTKSKEERAQEIKESPDWRSAGTRNYRNTPVRLARTLARGFARLPISERWSRRVAFALAALSYLWVLLLLGRSFDEVAPGYIPEAVLPIIYALPIPTIWGISALTPTELASLLVPAVIVIVVVLGGDLKRRSTCGDCGEPWALENEGTYYHRNSKTPKSETVNEKEYSWNEYEGVQLLRCIHEDCREYDFQETEWNDRPFWK